MKLHEENTISLVSPSSSAKQQCQMSNFQLSLVENVVVQLSLENAEVDNNNLKLENTRRCSAKGLSSPSPGLKSDQ